MSYGMHDYLAEKAMRNQYMQKKAAEDSGRDAMRDGLDPKTGVNTPELSLYDKAKAKANSAYSRSRAFVSEHPEILYGLGGAAAGAGLGALVSPKRRLLGSLIGLGLGGALGVGSKMAWDKYGMSDKVKGAAEKAKLNPAVQDVRQAYNNLRYGRKFQGMTPEEHAVHVQSLRDAGLLPE